MKGQWVKSLLVSLLITMATVAVPSFAGNGFGSQAPGSDPSYYFNRATNMYESGDFSQALFMFKVAALAGHAEAAIQVGLMYDFGLGAPRSFHEARRWYLKAALRNHPRGMYLVGHMEEFGEGRSKDFAKAFHWYQQAADLGEPNAQYALGEFYLTGKFVNKSDDRARYWLSLAAEDCHDQALVLLRYLDPENSPKVSSFCY